MTVVRPSVHLRPVGPALHTGRAEHLPGPHQRAAAALRIAFGVVVGIDAFLKWLPGFRSHFVHYVVAMESGQPGWVNAYLRTWVRFLDTAPTLYAYLVATCETCIALGLLLGLFSNATYLVGGLCMLTIWSTAEGFGGPYVSGTTDVGASIIYVFVYLGLYLGRASSVWSLDRRLWLRLGRWRFLSTPPAVLPAVSPR